MDKETTEAFFEYESLKLEMKKIEERLEELKPIIMPYVEPDKPFDLEHGFIEKKSRPNWKYSADTKALADTLKSKQKEEELNGIAVNVPTIYIQYNVKK